MESELHLQSRFCFPNSNYWSLLLCDIPKGKTQLKTLVTPASRGVLILCFNVWMSLNESSLFLEVREPAFSSLCGMHMPWAHPVSTNLSLIQWGDIDTWMEILLTPFKWCVSWIILQTAPWNNYLFSTVLHLHAWTFSGAGSSPNGPSGVTVCW